MSLTAVFTAGQKLTAAALNTAINKLVSVTIEKTSDTTRTSVTSRTADPHLVLALPANTTYDLSGLLIATSAANAAGDINYELQFPSDATVTWGGAGPHNSLVAGSQSDLESTAEPLDTVTPTGAFPYGTSTSVTAAVVKGRIKMVSAGNVTLAWAQLSSNVNGTTLKTGSFLTAVPVN
jgi:hypothetical protein